MVFCVFGQIQKKIQKMIYNISIFYMEIPLGNWLH